MSKTPRTEKLCDQIVWGEIDDPVKALGMHSAKLEIELNAAHEENRQFRERLNVSENILRDIQYRGYLSTLRLHGAEDLAELIIEHLKEHENHCPHS